MFALQFDQLDRQAELRINPAQLRQIAQKANSTILPVHRQQLLTQGDSLLWLTWNELSDVFEDVQDKHLIYLGQVGEQYYFSYRLTEPEYLIKQFQSVSLKGLRELIPVLSEADSFLANVAIGIEHWHNTHQYCGFCGHATYSTLAGFVRQCSNPECAKEHYPRTDAAVICAITYQDKILLVRQAQWPENRYSVIAGFVEPGESLEQAVAREANEEAGLTVTNIQYFGSQPWPFPQSLMTGFTAEATHPSIELKDDELEHASWFTRSQINELVDTGQLILPYQYSISRTLIEHWRNS
ncbi:NAD(+) diphosphatase [Kangiella koreensis]|uniref:NAD(+) diphosphatase n=1 Tax=Kangiella koreensis (strain DSM 16069 / JCM 12317 / KCTC 12182 / SW-125) TaxID=523791 RepID=C7R6I0_KANKD|nr:NAD(+) diphosphatase [Kangiella koreensis]ACV27408.1 NUDIX hydrolase [Kangiella koreensis DSM 16069]